MRKRTTGGRAERWECEQAVDDANFCICMRTLEKVYEVTSTHSHYDTVCSKSADTTENATKQVFMTFLFSHRSNTHFLISIFRGTLFHITSSSIHYFHYIPCFMLTCITLHEEQYLGWYRGNVSQHKQNMTGVNMWHLAPNSLRAPYSPKWPGSDGKVTSIPDDRKMCHIRQIRTQFLMLHCFSTNSTKLDPRQ